MKMEKLHIYEAIVENGEYCCPRCKDVHFVNSDENGNYINYIKIKNVEYPLYYCPDCDIFYTTSDFDY